MKGSQNVVLIILDSVRKDFFDTYAKRLQERADVVFEQCRAVSSWSAPSHASIISGQLPSEHGVHTHSPDYNTLPHEQTMFSHEAFKNAFIYGISSNVYAGTHYSFDTYFDKFEDITPSNRNPHGYDFSDEISNIRNGKLWPAIQMSKNFVLHENKRATASNLRKIILDSLTLYSPFWERRYDRGARDILHAAKETIVNDSGQSFLFMNIMDAHHPLTPIKSFDTSLYDVPPNWSSSDISREKLWGTNRDDIQTESISEYWEKYEQLYGATIEYLDRLIVPWIDDIQENTTKETTIILTSDHGENLCKRGEKGHIGHVDSLSESLLHVPYLVFNPPENVARNVKSHFSHLDVSTMITDVMQGNWSLQSRETVPSEMLGQGAGTVPDVEGNSQDKARRSNVCGTQKIIYDSSGNIEEWSIDYNQPSSQSYERDLESVPYWVIQDFPVDIDTALSEAQTNSIHNDVSNSVEKRLKRLGYST